MNPPGACPNIVLVGFMGSGKSSVGRLIAQRTGHRFSDTDQIVSQLTGMQISELFSRRGEEYFRDREKEALESLRHSKQVVIATGGGIVLRQENRDLLGLLGFVTWLTATEEVIYERVSRNNRRPLMQTDDPRRTIHELLEKRNPLYAAVAQLTVETSELTHAQIAEVILAEAMRAQVR